MNKRTRQEAITNLINDWICQEEDSLGQLATNNSFAILQGEIGELFKLGRSAKWETAIEEWLECTETAITSFCNQNGFEKEAIHTSGIGDFTYETGKHFARVIKWAVWQGATFAYIANS